MGQLLKEYFWFGSSPLNNYRALIKCLKENCCGSSREVQSYGMCWTVATIYWTLLVFMQHPQREEEESKATGTMAIQTAAYPQEQPVLRAVACIQKKKSKTKSVHVVSDEKEAGPSQQEEETGPEIITQTLSLSELRDMQKDFSLQSGEPLVTWVLLYWAIVARDMKLDGSDTLQLGCKY